jgi:hypothetical protein
VLTPLRASRGTTTQLKFNHPTYFEIKTVSPKNKNPNDAHRSDFIDSEIEKGDEGISTVTRRRLMK